jgi:amino acid transporter
MTMSLPQKNDAQFVQDFASRSDVEDQAIGTMHEVKRDLGRRHINMIAIAGMIVSEQLCSSCLTMRILI